MGNGPARPENYGERKPTHLCGEWTSPHGQRIELRLGDITMEDTTAIVNAANSRLMHGSGVAGAISKRGGPMIQDESDSIIKRRKVRVPPPLSFLNYPIHRSPRVILPHSLVLNII